jgi:hypothetical protein
MQITIHSTTKIVRLQTERGDTIIARIWEGQTSQGTPVHCYITRICPTIPEPLPAHVEREFTEDLRAMAKPTPLVEAIPLRMVL